MRGPLNLEATNQEKYDPAMAITDQREADAYFELLVEHAMLFGMTRGKAQKVERSNLGYWAGYYSHETRERVERLFRCAHPLFGAIAEKGPMSPEEIFEMGLRMGRSAGSAPQIRYFAPTSGGQNP